MAQAAAEEQVTKRGDLRAAIKLKVEAKAAKREAHKAACAAKKQAKREKQQQKKQEKQEKKEQRQQAKAGIQNTHYRKTLVSHCGMIYSMVQRAKRTFVLQFQRKPSRRNGTGS